MIDLLSLVNLKILIKVQYIPQFVTILIILQKKQFYSGFKM